MFDLGAIFGTADLVSDVAEILPAIAWSNII